MDKDLVSAPQLRPGLPPLPEHLKGRPLDHRGYPVPWFVAWVDGVPDFRIVDARKLSVAIQQRRCWVCGNTLGKFYAFPIGPMCAINRTIAEPPSHRDCAEWSAQACPFLILPKAKRREANVPDGASEPAGIALKRNPGAVCIWVTRSYRTIRDYKGGLLFRLGEPESVTWYSEGRIASRAEIMHSIETGLPLLRQLAEADGPDALEEFQKVVDRGLRMVPSC